MQSRDYKFKNTKSKNGVYTFHLNAELNKKLSQYCSMKNINKAKYITDCIQKSLQNDESEYLQTLPKEDLIKIILSK